MNIDFKYFFALIISIAGVSLTIWYANMPSSEKSLSLNVNSKSLLHNAGEQDIPGLKIFIDKNEIENPAITVLTIKNDGTIPIRSSDFESDVGIILEGGVELVRASVIETKPEWLKVTITIKNSQAHLSPVLLNPEESLTISLISKGLPTSISSRSRIAGVGSITIAEPNSNHIESYLSLVLAFIVSIPLVALYRPSNPLPSSETVMNRRTWFMVVFSLMGVVQTLTFTAVEDIFGFNEFWKLMGSLFAILLLALPLSLILNKPK